ncbi:GNAT family N-acetyltransferase [Actinomadura kijaniata]|uniref:GNAT family N-acetyltransferase n=1 Tax=Actinomadura kijaniata TaxID=46161 RepID=UPI003F1DCF1E
MSAEPVDTSVPAPVRLRPVLAGDLDVLDRFWTDPEVAGAFEWYGWMDPNVWRRRWTEDGLLGTDRSTLMVCSDTETYGFVAWWKVVTARTSFCWEIGITLLPEARGRGVGTEAQRQLVRYLFTHTQVVRIQAGTEVDNHAERRALEKAGFTREGVMRSVTFRDGAWRDGVLYSVLRDEVMGQGR